MASYLVEGYAPIDQASLTTAVARIRAAALAMTAGGRDVRHLEAILVPEDETCFHLVEASSVEDVRELMERAGMSVMRITVAVGASTLEKGVTRKCTAPHGRSRSRRPC